MKQTFYKLLITCLEMIFFCPSSGHFNEFSYSYTYIKAMIQITMQPAVTKNTVPGNSESKVC